jgi:hypothetical protein
MTPLTAVIKTKKLLSFKFSKYRTFITIFFKFFTQKRTCNILGEEYREVYIKWVNIAFPEQCIANSVSYDGELDIRQLEI